MLLQKLWTLFLSCFKNIAQSTEAATKMSLSVVNIYVDTWKILIERFIF